MPEADRQDAQIAGFRQSQPGSCGAASLMCAAQELGITWTPPSPDWGTLWQRGTPLSCDQTTEMRIYSVSSGYAGAIRDPRYGHSLPSYLCEVAKVLGLSATGFAPNDLFGSLLQLLFRSEYARAETLGVTIRKGPPPKPRQGERLLRVIRNGRRHWPLPAIDLHWIMERPDGSIMDPAGFEFGYGPGTAWNAPSLETITKTRMNQGIDYVDTGAGLLLFRS